MDVSFPQTCDQSKLFIDNFEYYQTPQFEVEYERDIWLVDEEYYSDNSET